MDCFKQLLLDKMNKIYPNKRKPRYTNEYYLDKILLMLNDRVRWISLIDINDKKNHHSTIRKKYIQILPIFKSVFNEYISTNYDLGEHMNTDWSIDLLIDGTSITNKNGSELVDKNWENWKKKVTKLSVIADIDRNILGVHLSSPFVSDQKCINKTFDSMPNKIKKQIKNNFIKVNLIADKGYIRKQTKKDKLEKKGIYLLTPYRKNQKKKFTDEERIKYKFRIRVESSIAHLKYYNRICIRRDKKESTYMGFVYLGLLSRIYEKI